VCFHQSNICGSVVPYPASIARPPSAGHLGRVGLLFYWIFSEFLQSAISRDIQKLPLDLQSTFSVSIEYESGHSGSIARQANSSSPELVIHIEEV
jgi:hypothetical protein